MIAQTALMSACLLLAACATSGTEPARMPAARAGAPEQLLQATVPAVDHHKHLMGPAIATIAGGGDPLPVQEVPAEFSRLLEERAAAAKDSARLAKLYTTDAAVLTHQRPGWLSGADKVANYLATSFGRPYSLTPVHFNRDRDAAQIAGYYTRGSATDRQYVGYFHLSLVRDAARGWRIAAETPRFPMASGPPEKAAKQLVAEMDAAGIRRAVVLSEAFWADGPLIPVADAKARVVAENDWTASQVQAFPDRLIAFCSFNPIADHALEELDRCAANDVFKGLKFSFAMSGVDLKKPEHVARVRAVLARANHHRLPVVVHLRGGPDYDASHVGIFVRELLPAAPDVVIQVAHLWGGETYAPAVLAAFADAVAADPGGTRNLYFDIAEITAPVSQTASPEVQAELATAMRRIGLGKMLFGSDGEDTRRSWRLLVALLPLTEQELRLLAANVAPYMRDAGDRPK